jgi:RNase P subunit RPR2
VRLSGVGGAVLVHCPECDGGARLDGCGVSCGQCGYMTIQKVGERRARWVRPQQRAPRCSFCGTLLPERATPTGFEREGALMARVTCPACASAMDFPAYPASPPAGNRTAARAERSVRLYLTAQVAGRTLWVDNLAHLALLEEWLGASLRERGPVRGLTMMARLPHWMKAATNRPKILRALAALRAKAEEAGLG